MTEALLKTGRHTVTAITRKESTGKLPEGVQIKTVDYNDHASLVEALRGQDALIITLSVMAPKDQDGKLIKAAAEADVPYILPNEWGTDSTNKTLCEDTMMGSHKDDTRKLIEQTGKSAWIAVATGFWYEWSLALPFAYGFDFVNHTATFFDDGEQKICTSTWPQVGRTIAALMSLPIDSKGEGACINDYKNSFVYVNSFTVSQKDMFESVLRVTATKTEDWKINKEPCEERYAAGKKRFLSGDRVGFGICLYTRLFFNDGAGDFEAKGLANEALGLPKENIDEATERAIKRSKEVKWP